MGIILSSCSLAFSVCRCLYLPVSSIPPSVKGNLSKAELLLSPHKPPPSQGKAAPSFRMLRPRTSESYRLLSLPLSPYTESARNPVRSTSELTQKPSVSPRHQLDLGLGHHHLSCGLSQSPPEWSPYSHLYPNVSANTAAKARVRACGPSMATITLN